MMPSSFHESNTYLGPPPGVSLEDCEALSVWKGEYPDGTPVVISCWRPTVGELEELQKTGRIWLHVWGHTMPPVHLGTDHPFTKEDS